jgi:hypothetical protein
MMPMRTILVDRDGNEVIVRMQASDVMPCNLVGIGVDPDGTQILYVLVHKDINQITPRSEWVPGTRCPR